jgi:hypothetical protein
MRDMEEGSQDEAFSTKAIRAELKAHGYIASIWHIDDVKEVRPDFTDEQAMQTLESVERNHDAEIGINWEVLRLHADFIHPQPDDQADTAPELEHAQSEMDAP